MFTLLLTFLAWYRHFNKKWREYTSFMDPNLSEIMQLYKCFPHMSKMPALKYNLANRVVIKNLRHKMLDNKAFK